MIVPDSYSLGSYPRVWSIFQCGPIGGFSGIALELNISLYRYLYVLSCLC